MLTPFPILSYPFYNTEYGQVLRMLGNGRCEVYCFDGKNRLAHIRGKMRKKVWVSAVSAKAKTLYNRQVRSPHPFIHLSTIHTQGDIVLLGMRDYQEDKVDIIHKYNADEARNLKAFGELPETGTFACFCMRLGVCGDDQPLILSDDQPLILSFPFVPLLQLHNSQDQRDGNRLDHGGRLRLGGRDRRGLRRCTFMSLLFWWWL